MILADRVGDFLKKNRLAGAWRRDDQPALSFPDRRDEIHDAHAHVAVFRLEAEPAFRVARTQIVEADARLRDLGFVAVDRLDFEQRQVSLPFLRRADLTGDRVTGAQVEPFDLRRRDVDVVRSVQIVPVLAAQKTVAFRQNLEDALAGEHDILIEQFLLDAEYEILLAQSGRVLDGKSFSHLVELGDWLSLQLGDVHGRRGETLRARLAGWRGGKDKRG